MTLQKTLGLVLLTCSLWSACAPPPAGTIPEAESIPDLPPNPEGDETPLTWYFVPEPGDSGTWRFHTRDPLLVSGGGRTLWKITGTGGTDTETLSGLIRYSGAERGGFGLVLQFTESPAPECYLLLIDTLGHRFVGRYREGLITVIEPWQGEPDLKTGRGVLNRISISERGPGAFDLRFNDGGLRQVRDPDPSAAPGTGRGWCAVITPGELFPVIPVDVRYLDLTED